MLNNGTFTGRFTKIPQLRYTPSGVAVLNFNLAVDRNFKDKNGNVGTDFPRCVAWRKTAENLANHCTKGSLIGVQTEFRTQKWQDQNGKTHYSYYFLIDTAVFLESKQVTDQRRASLGQQTPTQNQNQNQPNNQQNPFSPQPNNSNKQLAGVNANNQQTNSANQANGNTGNNGSANNGGNNQPNNNPSNQNSNQNPKNTGTKKPVNKGGNNKPAPKGNGNKKIDISDDDLPF